MIRSFVFSGGKLLGQDLTLDFLKVVLHDEGVHMWVDVSEVNDEEAKSLLEGVFNFHPLAIEDCLTPSDLPKVDEYEDSVFMVIHAVDYSSDVHEFRTRELNLFVGKNFLVTVHRDPIRSVTHTMERVQKNAPAVARAPDRLTYTLLDHLLENYDPALEELASEYAEVEKNMFTASATQFMTQVLQLKTEIQKLRLIVRPQREVLARFARGEFKIVRAHMLPYYRDLMDTLVRVSEFAENHRDALNHTLEVYAGVQQMKINEVIKVLTVMATLALPILAITSFYGMNFRHMPELEWKYAHLWVLGLTAALTGLIYLAVSWFIRRKGW